MPNAVAAVASSVASRLHSNRNLEDDIGILVQAGFTMGRETVLWGSAKFGKHQTFSKQHTRVNSVHQPQ